MLDVLMVPFTAAVSSARRRSRGCACRRAQPHGFVRNRWYPAATRDARVEWDFEDRLVKVTKADGTVVENTYDVDGVLVRTSVNVASGQRGSHFHQYHRGPGTHPVARRRIFALPVAARVA